MVIRSATKLLLTGVLFARLLSPATNPSVDSSTHFDDSVTPGRTLSITGGFDPANPPTVYIYEIGSSTPLLQLPANTTDGKILTFTLPDKVTPGRYYVTLKSGDTSLPVPGELRIQPAVRLDATHPTTAYRDPKTGLFNFDVIGDHFSADVPSQNQIYISGQGAIIRDWQTTGEACEQAKKFPCLWVEPSSTQKLHVVGYSPQPYQGPLKLSVRVGAVQSDEKDLVLARVSETGVLLSSIVVFLALAYIIYRLVARGIRDTLSDGKHISPFLSFFLDKESQTYSLSKFQLFLFSATFIFGYLYVFLCQWLVQWRFQLPDVPANIAGLLGISAGTTIAAAGATSARGAKGSGQVNPSAADFISTGGLVVPERFQFFVWTIVACLGFIALLISQNPATLQNFPSIPDGLLYIMGISSAGYLGGKLVRKPGPIIRNIAWDNDNQMLIVQGENLASDGAQYYIDTVKLPIVTPSERQAAGAAQDTKLVTATQQAGAPDPTFSTELKITIILGKAGVDLSSGNNHVFRIVNPDGQFADSPGFAASAIAIYKVAMADVPQPATPEGADANKLVAASQNPVRVKVTGWAFVPNATFEWTANDGTVSNGQMAAADITDSGATATLTLTTGPAGTAQLKLTNPAGSSAKTDVTVV